MGSPISKNSLPVPTPPLGKIRLFATHNFILLSILNHLCNLKILVTTFFKINNSIFHPTPYYQTPYLKYQIAILAVF